jgi:hypothetical protein
MTPFKTFKITLEVEKAFGRGKGNIRARSWTVEAENLDKATRLARKKALQHYNTLRRLNWRELAVPS